MIPAINATEEVAALLIEEGDTALAEQLAVVLCRPQPPSPHELAELAEGEGGLVSMSSFSIEIRPENLPLMQKYGEKVGRLLISVVERRFEEEVSAFSERIKSWCQPYEEPEGGDST